METVIRRLSEYIIFEDLHNKDLIRLLLLLLQKSKRILMIVIVCIQMRLNE